MKRTKIIATISAQNCTEEFIRSLCENGMDVVRLNTAHMEPEDMEPVVAVIRKVSDKIGILIDTKGPNIRTCGLAEPRSVRCGEKVLVSGDPAIGPASYALPAKPRLPSAFFQKKNSGSLLFF